MGQIQGGIQEGQASGRSLEEVMLHPKARRRPRPSRDLRGHRQEARCEQAWARGSATSSEPGGSPAVGREGLHARQGPPGASHGCGHAEIWSQFYFRCFWEVGRSGQERLILWSRFITCPSGVRN